MTNGSTSNMSNEFMWDYTQDNNDFLKLFLFHVNNNKGTVISHIQAGYIVYYDLMHQ